MGQRKEPGLWEEMGLGSPPRVTGQWVMELGKPQQKHKGQLSECVWGGGGELLEVPQIHGQEHRLPPLPFLLTSSQRAGGLIY